MKLDETIRIVSALGSDQHGLVRVDQFPANQRRNLDQLVRRGVIVRLTKGVYRVGGAPTTWMQLLAASTWPLGPTAVVSHASAARLRGFDRFDDEVVELTVLRGHRGRALPSIDSTVHTTLYRTRRDTSRVANLPVTSAERTILDLARSGTPTIKVEAAIDSAVRLRITTLDRIIDRISVVEGSARWGVAQLDALLITSGGHTLLERLFLKLMRRAGLPRPVPQVVHRKDGRHVARVDFLFENVGLVVEVSGGRGHSSPSERAKDARRRNELQRLGRTAVEFTYEQVTRDAPYVIATIRDFLAVSRFSA
jgi:hypothetical protein